MVRDHGLHISRMVVPSCPLYIPVQVVLQVWVLMLPQALPVGFTDTVYRHCVRMPSHPHHIPLVA